MTHQTLPYMLDDHGVATLTLSQPGRPVVVLDSQLINAIAHTLDRIAGLPNLAGFVLASDSRVFVAGANLQEISALSDEQLHQYLINGSSAFARIAALPCTTVAAINGAALGGGLEIAMHCDLLVAAPPANPAKPYQVGLPEASLGICPGWGGSALLPARIDPAEAFRQTATGRTMPFDLARSLGLFDAIAATPEDLLPTARRLASTPKPARSAHPRSIADARHADAARRARASVVPGSADVPDTPAAHAVLRCVDAALHHGWNACLQAEREHLVTLRHTEQARAALERFFAKA